LYCVKSLISQEGEKLGRRVTEKVARGNGGRQAPNKDLHELPGGKERPARRKKVRV